MRSWLIWLILFLSLPMLGCSQAPSRVSAPSWDPAGFSDAVMSKLDKNSDGSLDKTELAAAPGLAWGALAIDTDKNGSLNRDEIVARFERYKKMKIGITSSQMQVLYRGQPLAGAKVKLLPEFFLEGLVEPAEGETFSDGYVSPLVAGVTPPGLRVGYYRVIVESSRIKIPAKYTQAESTPLGVEVSPVQDVTAPSQIQFVIRD